MRLYLGVEDIRLGNQLVPFVAALGGDDGSHFRQQDFAVGDPVHRLYEPRVFQPFIFALTISTFGKSNTKRPNQQPNTSKRSSKNTLQADLKITITYEVKQMKHNENKNINWITMMTMFMEYMTLQNEYNAYRIKEYKEWEDKDCICDLCNQAIIQTSEDNEPKFGEEFKGDWE